MKLPQAHRCATYVLHIGSGITEKRIPYPKPTSQGVEEEEQAEKELGSEVAQAN